YLDTISLKYIKKEPLRLYGMAQELADELGRFLRDEPLRARPVGPAGKAWRWCRRKPALATSFLAVLVLMLIVIIGAPIAVFRIDREKKQATEKLWDSYLAQASAKRLSTRAGRRFDSLEALKKAAKIRPSPELRNEAIACMALTDLRVVKPRPIERPAESDICFDPTLGHYAIMNYSEGS